MIIVRKIQIPSRPTKKPRRLYVYLPKEYGKTDRRYPVLYMFDGHNVFYNSHATYGKSWGMKEYLEKTKMPLIVVGIECNPEDFKRLSEYSPWTFTRRGLPIIEGKGKETMDWITGTLKPEIDRTYRTLPDRENTMIAGSSMGGLMTIYAAVEYNAYFARAASLSPSLWVNRKAMKELIASHPLAQPTQIYMDYGSGEAEGHRFILGVAFEVAKYLTKAGANVDMRVVPDAMHSEAYWEKRIPVFFDYLFNN